MISVYPENVMVKLGLNVGQLYIYHTLSLAFSSLTIFYSLNVDLLLYKSEQNNNFKKIYFKDKYSYVPIQRYLVW